ncbi:hypothetical protein D3C73_1044440 [compost metagenome]
MIEIDAGVETQSFQYRDQHFQLGIARPGTKPTSAAVNNAGARLNGGQRIRHRHAQVVMRVENQRHLYLHAHGRNTCGDILRQKTAGRIHNADRLGAVTHQ